MNIKQVVEIGIKKKASDINIFEDACPCIRVNGVLDNLPDIVSAQEFEEFLKDDKIELIDDKSKDFGITVYGQRVRVNLYNSIQGRAMAMRIMPKNTPTPEELRLPKEVIDIVNLKKGLVIVAGVTGSGKSTTLASLIEKINSEQHVHIVTAEEPIEYVFTPKRSIVSQREVGTHVRSFAEAARDAMRQRPDVVLLGECRDRETVTEMVKLAKTGQLLLTTIHSDSAASVLDRITDMYPESVRDQIRSEVIDVLEYIVHQMLIPTKTGELVLSTEVIRANQSLKAVLRKQIKSEQIREYLQMSRGDGCLSRLDNLKDLNQKYRLNLEVVKARISETDYRLLTRGRL